MKFIETALAGVFIVEKELHRDDRGFFARSFCREEFARVRYGIEFVQSNISQNKIAGTTRGLHFQRPPYAECKLVGCLQGSALDVVVDIRRGSSSFLKHIAVEISADNERMIFIPEGCAHGFQTLEDNTRLSYQHTAYYEPGYEGGLRYNDPRLAIEWPLAATSISDKDQQYALIGEGYEGLEVSS